MQPHFRWSFASLPLPHRPETEAKTSKPALARASSFEFIKPQMTEPSWQQHLSRISDFTHHAQSMWQNKFGFGDSHSSDSSSSSNSDHFDPSKPPANTDDEFTESRLAKLDYAKDYFTSMDWSPHASRRADQTAAQANVTKSRVPAICIEAAMNAPTTNTLAFMMQNISEYQNWLPIISSLTVVQEPSLYERVISIETQGKFGIGARCGLAQATFDMRNGAARVLIEKLPEDDERYETLGQKKGHHLKHFETYMEFLLAESAADTASLTYYNHTDPNIPFVPKRTILNESLENHQSFVEKCTQKLVEFHQSLP